ncbi:amidohydrolase family-domain-containing protein [Amylostereum chailletii]|nr:amidohydrolase family-domain-containing protein [Amylostereum chailletii]
MATRTLVLSVLALFLSSWLVLNIEMMGPYAPRIAELRTLVFGNLAPSFPAALDAFAWLSSGLTTTSNHLLETYALCSSPQPSPVEFTLQYLGLAYDTPPRIHTSDPTNPLVDCILVEQDVIAVAGSREHVTTYWETHHAGEHLSTFYPPNNAIVVPGLTDAHAHTLQWGYKAQLPLSDCKSVDEIVEKVEAYVRAHPDVQSDPQRWIRGMGWDQTKFPGSHWPTAADFDRSPLLKGRLIALTRTDAHAVWVSNAVLDLLPSPLPISDDEILKRGGMVLRNPDGALTGVFVDTAELLLPLEPPTDGDRKEWFEVAVRDALSVGLTNIHDAWVERADADFYMKLAEKGDLPFRMYLMGEYPTEDDVTVADCVDKTCAQHGQDEWPFLPRVVDYGLHGRLTLRSVKLFSDGALGSFGAALLEPYSDDPTTSGLMRTPPEVLREQIEKLYAHGWQVNTHAIGDRANKAVLDIYEDILIRANASVGVPGAVDAAKMTVEEWRPRIEHVQIMRLEDLERVGRLGVIPSVQPTHATSDMWYAESRLGSERVKGAYVYATLTRNARNGVVPLGSDFPVEDINPLRGFYAAISRLNAEGNSPHGKSGWYPDENLTRQEALRGMTAAPAYAAFAEDKYGALRKGLKADFVVLDRDVMTVPVEEILGTKVLATVVDGRTAYGTL